MRLRVNFSFIDSKEVNWYRPLEDFPKIIKFLGKNYEWAMYDTDPSGKVDRVLTFSEIPNYDVNFNIYCPFWEDICPETVPGCECGAKYSSFSWDHMKFCRMWIRW